MRLTAARIDRELTQAQFAEAAGVSKRTVERLEDGQPTQLGNLIRRLRALDMLEGLERLLPEMPAHPVELLKSHRGQRSRVRSSRGGGISRAIAAPTTDAPLTAGWVWDDKK